MKKYLFNFFTFIIFISILYSMISFFIPFGFNNIYFNTKKNYLKDHINKYNTFFLGGSRVYRGIDPSVFDSVVKTELNKSIKSFNLGIPAGTLLESYYILDKFLLENKNTNIKYIFVDLKNIRMLARKDRDNYWFNFEDLIFLQKLTIKNDSLNFKNKLGASFNNLSSYIYAITQKDINKKMKNPLLLGSLKNGYLSLEQHLNETDVIATKEYLTERKEQLKKDTLSSLLKRKIRYDRYETNPRGVREIHKNKIINLINKANDLDINLIFFITPRIQNSDLISLYNDLPKCNKMEFSTEEKFDSLFKPNYLFDKGHANRKGTVVFTEMFAKNFVENLAHCDYKN